MHFLVRAATGLGLMVLTAALLATAGWRFMASVTPEDSGKRPGARERSYTVEALQLTPQSYTPTITAYGEILAWRSLELRASTSGIVVDLNERFRDGARIAAGETLFRIDTRTVQSGVATSEVQLAQTRSDLAESEANAELVAAELNTARRQLEIAERELTRQRQLRKKGLVSEGAVENAELTVSNALQAISTRQQSLLASRMRVDTARLAEDRAKIALGDATTGLTETTITAPFTGQLADVNASLGRRVTGNEKLGQLIDTSTLEVAFQVRDSAFARLLDANDSTRLLSLPVQVTLALGSRTIRLTGVLDRAAATVDPRQGGRRVFARINNSDGSALRPGDFVEVTVTEPALDQVIVLPSRAVTEDGLLYVVNDDDRLEEIRGSIVRRQGSDVIIDNLDPSWRVVLNRLPQLSSGVRVSIREERSQPGVNKAAPSALVELSDERRQKLVEAIEKNTFIPDGRRQKMLERLKEPKVPRRMIERIESRMKG